MKHGENRRSVSKKMFIAMLALVLALGCAVGGTIAWLTAQTPEVKNTFTYGNINIELKETTGTEYKIIPGTDIDKDPKVTVKPGSEACWLFVKVVEDGTFVDKKVTYAVDTGEGKWTQGDGTNIPKNVYYREVDATTALAGITFNVLKDNKVFVSDTLTKDDIKNLTNPTLTFTAYAVQKDGIATAELAWAKIGA